MAVDVSEHWRIAYDARDVFDATTLGDAAALIEQRIAQGAGVERNAFVKLTSDARRGVRASHAQRALWMTWAQDPQSNAYNMSGVLSIDGSLEPEAMQRAFDTLVSQHDILRARFELNDEGEPLQIVDEDASVALRFSDLCDEPSRIDELTQRTTGAAFDLERGPLLRAHLLRVDANAYRLVIVLHHIIADGWFVNVLLESLLQAYRAQIGASNTHVEKGGVVRRFFRVGASGERRRGDRKANRKCARRALFRWRCVARGASIRAAQGIGEPAHACFQLARGTFIAIEGARRGSARIAFHGDACGLRRDVTRNERQA
ncbi:Pyoverdine sidechain non-ribosomal peptide [Candidatus Burkholderia humilis]|nr:Pyoverdine sidechain non-ribosomal peptide [Candidatus Burkholderia humilis]